MRAGMDGSEVVTLFINDRRASLRFYTEVLAHTPPYENTRNHNEWSCFNCFDCLRMSEESNRMCVCFKPSKETDLRLYIPSCNATDRCCIHRRADIHWELHEQNTCLWICCKGQQASVHTWMIRAMSCFLHVTQQGRADKSPQQWRQTWTSARSSRANFMFFSFLMNGLWHDKVGAMLLRALVHFGNAPLAFSSAIFDCALGRRGMTWATWVPTCWRWRNSRSLARLCKLPPDDIPGSPCLKRDFWAWGGHHISSEHD